MNKISQATTTKTRFNNDVSGVEDISKMKTNTIQSYTTRAILLFCLPPSNTLDGGRQLV